METVSSGFSRSTSIRKEFLSSGSLSGSSIDPDVSIRKTRLERGFCACSIS